MADRRSTSRSGTPLLSSRFRFEDQPLLFARARLYEDRIVFQGLGWTGWQRRIVPVDEVAQVEWWTRPQKEINLALCLHDDEVLRLWMEGAGLWKYQVTAHAPNLRDETSVRTDPLASAA